MRTGVTFAAPFPMYRKMRDAMDHSALTRHTWHPRRTWQGLRKKVAKSRRAWGEDTAE